MKIWSKNINQAGDTIVEVVIAVAIISSVLVGAFIVSQKSALAVRDSQEHGEALQVLQGQVELVRAMVLAEDHSTNHIFDTSPKYFCVDGADPNGLKRVDFQSTVTELPSADSDPYDYYAPECKDIQGRYNIAVSYDDLTYTFTFHGRWDRLGGGKNEVKMAYRVYAVN